MKNYNLTVIGHDVYGAPILALDKKLFNFIENVFEDYLLYYRKDKIGINRSW